MANEETESTKDVAKSSSEPAQRERETDLALNRQQEQPRAGEQAREANPFFPHYPKTRFHPVYGRKTVKDPNEEFTVFRPAHDWFDTAELADMHRTETEASAVMHHNKMVKHEEHLAVAAGEEPWSARTGIVRNSVAAQESLDAGNAEPL